MRIDPIGAILCTEGPAPLEATATGLLACLSLDADADADEEDEAAAAVVLPEDCPDDSVFPIARTCLVHQMSTTPSTI